MAKSLLTFCCFVVFGLLPICGFSQKKENTQKIEDTIISNDKILDTSVSSVIHYLELYTETLNKANAMLKRGFDTSAIADNQPDNERVVNLIQKNINNGQLYNLRILYTNRVVLIQLKKKQRDWQEELLRYSHQIDAISKDIETMSKEPLFAKLSNDTGYLSIYMTQMKSIVEKWKQAEDKSKLIIQKITLLENRSIGISFHINDLIDEINYRINNFHKHVFKQEEPYLFNVSPKDYRNNIFKVYFNTFKKIGFILPFYLSITANQMLWHLIWIFALFFWFTWCMKRVKEKNKNALIHSLPYISQGVIYMILFFVFLMAPFIYDTPPLSLVQLNTVLMLGIYTKYVWNTWTELFKRLWIYFLIIFFGISLDVILLEPAFLQRWLLFLLNISSVVLSYYIIKEVSNNRAKYANYYLWLLYLFVLLNGLAFLMNVSGRVALAKLFSNGAIISVAFALSLDILESLVFEIVYLNMEAFKNSKISKMFSFSEIKQRLKIYVQVSLFVFWFFIFCFSLNFYDILIQWIGDWFSKVISIGDFSFKLGSVSLFIFIIWIANNISKLLMFFFGSSVHFATNEKNKHGSWVLLLRIVIYTLGLFVAIAAAGIPMDKVTIILGALGVGIGFGLQNIVSNLISGVVLAFEKPMQIGDVIEIDNKTGTVKEIGIRSSKITTYDDADLFAVKQLIMDVIQSHNEVQQFPKPAAFVHQFSESSIDFRVLFWTSDFDNWIALKSSILLEVFDVFRKNNIVIPYPQRDINIKNNQDISVPSVQKNETENKKDDLINK